MSKPKPPESLESAGRALWSEIVKDYDLRVDELHTLQFACRALDLAEKFDREWVEMGQPLSSKGSTGQDQEHFLISAADKQRKASDAFLKRLALPDEAASGAVGTNPARAAAATRWKHGA